MKLTKMSHSISTIAKKQRKAKREANRKKEKRK